MRYVRTSHYVEKSYARKPSFTIVLQNDNNEEISFISNGCVFLEMNESNLNYLISRYNCKECVDELLNSPIENDSEIVNADYMFWNAKELTEIYICLPNATVCTLFFRSCPSLVSAVVSLPKVKDFISFLEDCNSLKEATLKIPNIKKCPWFFHRCRSLQRLKLNASKDLGYNLFLEGCPLNKEDIEFI